MAQAFDAGRMANNVAEIRRRMAEAAISAGRRPEEVLLCAACKTRGPETIRESALLPVDLFGENRVQEMLVNFGAGAYLGKPCHFIGRLQTNKVKKVVGRVSVIESVDSLRLLESIQREAVLQGLRQDILIEINIGEELSKGGVATEDLRPMLDAAAVMQNVRVRGLMAIPPAAAKGEESRRCFALLRRLFEQTREWQDGNTPLDTLSMGMTDSFEAAILEGATIVRVGTGIYGARG